MLNLRYDCYYSSPKREARLTNIIAELRSYKKHLIKRIEGRQPQEHYDGEDEEEDSDMDEDDEDDDEDDDDDDAEESTGN